MESDFLIIIIVGGVIAGALGVAFAKVSLKIKNNRIQRGGHEFLIGKKKNIIRVDGEDIDVKKFIIKDYDGQRKELVIGEGTNNQTTPIEQQLPTLEEEPSTAQEPPKSKKSRYKSSKKKI